ncbi:hypothetical protein [Cardinium endosymbiont of Dermatophagoides farinae]|uniref:hypothetical protein n=1 Tax=Cardinium endosymbiont of Dermatophagoides farinae TaxID=2597823 RepID=UPI0011831073|nr:hypothetical protein [Cardinium endosymbiont of Dermatophagoides farinae]TSJ80764.1 hypothetical protein FPG78_01695 [Cardinium endosymbiont of Dermatophagoides farinae]
MGGAAGARVDAAMLAQNLTASVLKDLRTLSFNLGYAKNELEKQLMLNVQSNQVVCSRPGGKDLMPGSAFLAEVRKSLHKEKVPILAIGAGQNNFRALLTKKKARRFKLKALNDIYTFFVVGEKRINGRHDMQVSVDSQHALHIVPKKKKNFTRLLIKDAFHSSYVLTVPVPKDKAILCHPTALGAVVNFAKTIFK